MFVCLPKQRCQVGPATAEKDARGAEVLAHFVVAGGTIDERASFLTSSFFPAKNFEETNRFKR